MLKRLAISAVLGVLLVLGLTDTMFSSSAAPQDPSAGCRGTFTIGVGGFNNNAGVGFFQDSLYVPSDQPVGYPSLNLDAGAAELARLFDEHRNYCPGDHIKMLGHSGGAAVVHKWVSAHKDVQNANAILVADAKRAAGPGGPGLAGWTPLGVQVGELAAMVGIFKGSQPADADFGDFPVLTICNAGDFICNTDAGPIGYMTTDIHGRYDMNPWNYDNWARGQDWREIYP